MIGVFGGTFDPVHLGHLRPALELREELGLREILFIPCGQPPHRALPRASAAQRWAMLEQAVAGQAEFVLDDRELRRPGPSYMVDTLASLREELGDMPLCLILGMDAFLGLPGWHRWETLTALAHLVVVHRPGAELPAAAGPLAALLDGRVTTAAALSERPAGLLLFHPVTQLEISSSHIRRLAAQGRNLRYLTPDAVCEYIAAHGLYRHLENGND